MAGRSGSVFAGRGIALPAWWITAGAVVLAFALGIGAGWLTGHAPAAWERWTAASSASPSASPEPSVVASVTPEARALDAEDRAAGLTSLSFPLEGPGTYAVAPGEGEERADAGPVRFVRIDVEEGSPVDAAALADFVMETLNDPRGWGSAGRQQFVLTAGVPDVRLVLASDGSVAELCPALAAGDPATGGPTPEPGPEGTCVAQGIAPVSLTSWVTGVQAYGEDRTGARRYLLQHAVGRALQNEVVACESGRAPVMADQTAMPEECEPNPWPFPDAEVAAPAPTPSAG